MSAFLETVNSYVWSNALVYLCLAAGVYFSFRSKFVQVRQFKEMIRLMLKGEKSPAGVSSFQALTMSLAGRVGTGPRGSGLSALAAESSTLANTVAPSRMSSAFRWSNVSMLVWCSRAE